MMKKRKLGKTGLSISEISFGAWQLGNNQAWGGMDDQTAYNLVSEAIDYGINLFDTAPNYAAGQSETLLGRALQGKRNQIVLVSKFGHNPAGEQDFSVQAFHESIDSSLRRLQTDYLDVLLIHNPSSEMYEGQDPVWNELEAAQRQGKIRHFGASLDFASDIELCLNNTNSGVLEIFFNILHQDVRRAFPLVHEKKVGILAKVPLDSGWLTGRFDAMSRFSGVRKRWSEDDINKRAALVSELEWLTVDGSSMAQKSLAYLLSYKEVSCVIPGIRNLEQLQTNLGAADSKISEEERAKLEFFWDEFTREGKELLPW